MNGARDPFGLGPAGFEGLADGLMGAAEAPKLRRDLAVMTTRAAQAEAKIEAVRALCFDPGESHRLLTRREILRLLA